MKVFGRLVVSFVVLVAAVAAADVAAFDLSLRAETGVVAVPFHTIQFGEDGDRFDYREQGGQEILFPYSRLTAEGVIAERHEVETLFQPLRFETRSRIPDGESIRVDGVDFEGEAGGTPLDLGYSFDFWRGVYRYRFADTPRWSHAFGGGLQVRNASISFETADGEQRVVSQDLGPVPVLSYATRYSGEGPAFVEATVEGFWAPIRYLNLRDVDVNGWLYDAALRAGVAVNYDSEAFLSVRALGGGSDGTGPAPTVWTQTQQEPRYTYNNLNTVALTLGARARLNR